MGFSNRVDKILDGIGDLFANMNTKTWVAFGVVMFLGWKVWSSVPVTSKGDALVLFGFLIFLLISQGIVTGRSVMDDVIRTKDILKKD